MPSNPWSRPSIWGKPTWMFLYCVAKTFPESPTSYDKKKYIQFFSSLQYVLPCKKCQYHYRQWIKQFPIHLFLNNSHQLSRWLLLLDNYIRLRLHKPLIHDLQEYFL